MENTLESPPETQEAQPKVKVGASDLGCHLPYSLTYKGKIRRENDQQTEFLQNYVSVYRQAVWNVIDLYRSMIAKGGGDELLAYLIISPSKVPQHIEKHPSWVNAKGDKQNQVEPLADLMKAASFHALRGLAGHPRETNAKVAITKLATAHKLSTSVTLDQINLAVSQICNDTEKSDVFNRATIYLKVHIALVENWNAEIKVRQARIAEIEKARPEFFHRMTGHLNRSAAWHNACRWYRTLRSSYFDNRISPKVIAACQMVAMQQLKDKAEGWKHVGTPFEDQYALARENEGILQDFINSAPVNFDDPSLKVDEFRRLKPIQKPFVDLAKDGRFMLKVMEWFNEFDQVYTTAEDKLQFVTNIQENGKSITHFGFRQICLSPKDKRHAKVLEFISGDFKDWMELQKPYRQPTLNEKPTIWPSFAEGKYGWSFLSKESEPLPNRNEFVCNLIVPPHVVVKEDGTQTHHDRTAVRLVIRGNMPFRHAESIPSMDVKNKTQFRPNMVIHKRNAKGDYKTYMKAQAMMIASVDGELFAYISATHLTETVRDAKIRKEIAKHVKTGERVAVLHYLPGGQRVGNMMIFEKSDQQPGWRRIHIRLYKHFTHDEAYKTVNNKRIRINRNGIGYCEYVPFEDLGLSVATDALQTNLKRLTAQKTDQVENVIREIGSHKKNIGRTIFKRLAAHITRICEDNGVAYLLVAGGGGLRSRGGVSEPVKNMFTMSPLSGTLVDCLQKAGIQLFIGRSVASDIFMRDALKGDLSNLRVGVGFRQLCRDEYASDTELSVSFRGVKNLLFDAETGNTHLYPINGCWALLMYYFDETFRKAADKSLKSESIQLEKAVDFAKKKFAV